MKQCIKCKEWKNESEFYKRKETKDGLRNDCKKCRIEKSKENYENDSGERKQKMRSYYENHKEEIIQKAEEYRENHREEINQQNKEYLYSSLEYNSTMKWRKEIELYEEIRQSINDNVEIKCAYCGDWFEPTKNQINNRLKAINGKLEGEHRLYCSDKCKENCPYI